MESDQVGAGIIDASFMQLSGNFGTLRLGSVIPITATLAKSAGNVGAINLTNGDTNSWIVAPSAIVGASVSTTNAANDAMKIVYMTPSFSGFVVGANYTPSETNTNTLPLVGGTSGTDQQTYAGSVAYTTKFNSASIAADFGYWESHGNASASYNAHRMGVKVGFGPWTVGASRKEAKDTHNTSDTMAHDTYDAGLSWKGGDWTVGVQMVNSSSNQTAAVSGDDEVTKYSIGAVYNMGPGVDLVGTIAHVNWEDELQNVEANNNSGMAAVGGISVKF
jgi:predicted porin